MYSFYQFAAQTLNYFNRNLDNLLIGKFMSKDKLGYYSKAYSMQQMPVSYLPGVITPILHPILSEHQDDREYIFSNYLNFCRCWEPLALHIAGLPERRSYGLPLENNGMNRLNRL